MSAPPKLLRFDARLDLILRPDAVVEELVSGLTWLEGPVWDAVGGRLLFSEIPANRILSWGPEAGLSVFLHPSGYSGAEPFRGPEPGSNGLALDRQGRLILCQHGDRRLARLEPDGSLTALVTHFEGRRLHSPNDVVVKSNGDLYFTDPPYGLPRTFEDPARELPFYGVYRLTPPGELTLLTDEFSAPNGLAFSPDESLLYVSNSDPRQPLWKVFEVDATGGLACGRVFQDASVWQERGPGLPDGLKVDVLGNIFATAPGGLAIFSSDGARLGMLDLGQATGNCALGEGCLWIASSGSIFRLSLL